MSYYIIGKEDWDKRLEQLIQSHTVFATVVNGFGQDYELLKPETIPLISYNIPKPATPLKSFFLPVKENVTSGREPEKPRIIMGIPNCDIEGLNLLDEIYLDDNFADIFFRERHNQTILISSDCFSTQEHCHCLSYDIKPYSTKTADLSVIQMNGSIIFRGINVKGEKFIKEMTGSEPVSDMSIISSIDMKHEETEVLLRKKNIDLPDYRSTGRLVPSANMNIWNKYSSDCVSCGACATICPLY